MNLNINVEYAVREQERLEIERRNITLRIAAWVRRCAALTAFSRALTSEECSSVSAERSRRANHCRARTGEQALVLFENNEPRETDMQKGKRPSACFNTRDEDTVASELAGQSAGGRDAVELDDNDPEAAWLEHVDNGGTDSPEHYEAFVASYETAYVRAVASFASEPDLPLPYGV